MSERIAYFFAQARKHLRPARRARGLEREILVRSALVWRDLAKQSRRRSKLDRIFP